MNCAGWVGMLSQIQSSAIAPVYGILDVSQLLVLEMGPRSARVSMVDVAAKTESNREDVTSEPVASITGAEVGSDEVIEHVPPAPKFFE